ncbi:MAG TPA: ATP-binding protein [Candidatus Saccharimonadia bacterium]
MPANQPQPAASPDPPGRITAVLTRITLYATAAYLAGTLIWLFSGRTVATDLRFNWFAVLDILSCVSNLVAVALLGRVRRPTPAVQWLAVTLLSLALWSGGEAMLRLSGSLAATAFWGPVTTLGAAFVPSALYLFALSYTGSKRAAHPGLTIVLLSASLIPLFVDLRTNLINRYGDPASVLTPWGYIVPTGPLFAWYAGWFVLVGMAAATHIWLFYRRQTDSLVRRQALLICAAVLLPLVFGAVTNGIMPVVGNYSLPPLATMLTAAMGLLISLAMLRHRSFVFTSQFVADQILATMHEAVIGLSADLHVQYANAGAERLFNTTASALRRSGLLPYLSQQISPAQFLRLVEEQFKAGNYAEFDSIDFRVGRSRVVTAKLSFSRVIDDDGQRQGYLAVFTDITEMAQATAIIERQVAEKTADVRQAKAQLDSSLNSVQFGFVITDDRPEVVVVNRPAHELFCGKGHHAEDCPAVNLAFMDSQLEKPHTLLKATQQCLMSRRAHSIKALQIHGRTWRVHISPVIEDRRATGAAIFLQDITEEQVLARSRDEFFSIASHELRTPLTAIKGSTAMMLAYYSDSFKDPELKEMVDDIHESSQRLITIVNDFLDASRLEQGRFTYAITPVDPRETVAEVMKELKANADAKHVGLVTGAGLAPNDPAVLVATDPGRLKQILYNLVGNALKFTDTGSITVSAQLDDKQLQLDVTDTGHGIALKEQPILFHKFQQATADPLTRDAVRGTGLGLYISRLMARGMHGDLILKHSEPGQGSTFMLIMPLAKAELSRHAKNPMITAK